MNDEEKRKRIETLLLALDDWCDEAAPFLSLLHDELLDLVIGKDRIDYPSQHWANMTNKVEADIYALRNRLSQLLIEYRDPSLHSSEIQERADNRRKRME